MFLKRVDMGLLEDDIVEIKKVLHDDLLEKVKGNQVSLKSVYEKFSVYGLLFVLMLGLLDFFTFTDTFHFKASEFLNIYVFNTSLFNSALLLIIVFFPIVLLSLLFLIPYLAVISSSSIGRRINCKYCRYLFIPILCKKPWWKNFYYCKFISQESCIQSTIENKHSSAIRLSLAFNFIFITSSLIVFWLIGPKSIYIWKYLLGIFIPVFLGFLLTTSCFKYRKSFTADKSFSSLFVLYNIPMFVLLCLALSFLFSENLKFLLGIVVLLMTIPLIISSQLADFYSAELNNKNDYTLPPLVFFALVVSLIVASTGIFYNVNQKTWIDQNLSKNDASMNLFLNKYFLSSNNKKIDINISDISTPNECNFDKTKFPNQLDETAYYLPISKDIALYFTDINESDRTIIFAMKETDNKHEALAIGCLNRNKKTE